MSVEKVGGFNKLPSKDLKRVEPRRVEADDAAKKSPDSQAVADNKDKVAEKGKESSLESLKAALTDSVELSWKERVEPEDMLERAGKDSIDSIEISWKDPDITERIREMIERIQEDKEAMAKRMQAASILIMKKAYNDNQEIIKTAEAILRGEDAELDRVVP